MSFADVASNPPSLDPTDLLSIADRLGGKRIDNAIERARSSGIPLQGIQTGGFSPSYLHLTHIPLFPLYHEKQLEALQKQEQRKQQKLKYVKPPQKENVGNKLLFSAIGMLSGGGNVMSMAKWENRLKGAGAVSTQRTMEQRHSLVFTRWTVPSSSPGQEIWFIDVLEWRAESGGAQVMIKVGKQVSFKVFGEVVKERKVEKSWSKSFWKGVGCEELVWMKSLGVGGVGGEEVEMEIVARIERPCAGMEARASLKIFDKQWVIPVVASE